MHSIDSTAQDSDSIAQDSDSIDQDIERSAEDYVERAAALDPALATFAGIAGHDGELPDLSAGGFAERAGLDRSTLMALDAARASGPREQAARAAMRERLSLAVERFDAGDTSDLNVIDSWVQRNPGCPVPGDRRERE